MNPDEPIILKGESAELFDKYRKRKATKKEIEFFKKSEEFYLEHCQPETMKR